MISRYPELIRYLLDLGPRVVPPWGDIVGAFIAISFAIGFILWLVMRAPSRWLLRFFVAQALLLSVSVSFGFVYHYLFQTNPKQFKLNAPIEISRVFVSLEQEQEILDKVAVQRKILAWTLAALNSQEGEQRLRRFVKHISGEIRSDYITTLCLAVVAPPEPISLQDAELSSLLRQETPDEMQRHLNAQENVLKSESVGVLSPIPVWDQAMNIPLDHIVDITILLEAVLQGRRPAISANPTMSGYLTAQDSEKLRKYMSEDLGVQLGNGERVDLSAANDQIAVYEISTEALISVTAADWERLMDFQYFSLTTLTLVGVGDILPNSASARGWMSLEIIVGTAMLGFVISRLLDR